MFAFETEPLKLVAMLLACCPQLPIALQTLFAYASFALVSELSPHPAANTARTASSKRVGTTVPDRPASDPLDRGQSSGANRLDESLIVAFVLICVAFGEVAN